jgi:hypothetical protein
MSRAKEGLWKVLLGVLLVGIAGCSYSGSLGSVQCEDDGECEGEAVCRDGYCVAGADLDAGNQQTEDVISEPDTNGGEPDVGECEGAAAFCARHGAECGEVTAEDLCGEEQTVDCTAAGGGCEGVQVCEGNSCECPSLEGLSPAELGEEICGLRGAQCGSLSPGDVCGEWGELDDVECGECSDPGQECGEILPNMCGCPCLIGEVCVEEGALNPANPCESCQPDVSTTSYEAVSDGTSCDGAPSCQAGSCQGGSCEYAPICEGSATSCGCTSCAPCEGTTDVEVDSYACCNGAQLCTCVVTEEHVNVCVANVCEQQSAGNGQVVTQQGCEQCTAAACHAVSCETDGSGVGSCEETEICTGEATSCGCDSCTNCSDQDGIIDDGEEYQCRVEDQCCWCQNQLEVTYGCDGNECVIESSQAVERYVDDEGCFTGGNCNPSWGGG